MRTEIHVPAGEQVDESSSETRAKHVPLIRQSKTSLPAPQRVPLTTTSTTYASGCESLLQESRDNPVLSCQLRYRCPRVFRDYSSRRDEGAGIKNVISGMLFFCVNTGRLPACDDRSLLLVCRVSRWPTPIDDYFTQLEHQRLT